MSPMRNVTLPARMARGLPTALRMSRTSWSGERVPIFQTTSASVSRTIVPPIRKNPSRKIGIVTACKPLLRPAGDLAERGALENFQPEQDALHPSRADTDADVFEDRLARQPRDVFELLTLDRFGEHRRRRLTDRAALAGEAYVLHSTVFNFQFEANLVAAQRVEILGDRVGLLEVAEVPRIAIVVEDIFFVEIFHVNGPPARCSA